MRFIATRALLVAAVAAPTFAQNEPDPKQPQTPPPTSRDRGTDTTAAKNSDECLATMLLLDNKAEVALAQLAQQRATDNEVKSFAKQMENDHTQFGKKLEACCTGGDMKMRDDKNADRTDRTDPKSGAGDRPTTTDNGRKTDTGIDHRAARSLETPADHIELMKELGEKCLESTKKSLMEKNGADFDRCYVGMQVFMHQHVLDTIEVFRDYASPTLRQTLADGEQTVRMHLSHAKELAKRLETTSTRTENKGS